MVVPWICYLISLSLTCISNVDNNTTIAAGYGVCLKKLYFKIFHIYRKFSKIIQSAHPVFPIVNILRYHDTFVQYKKLPLVHYYSVNSRLHLDVTKCFH